MPEQLLDSVKSKYAAVAESTLSSDHAGVKAVAEAFGYTAEELTSIPAAANMGLSCGNPTGTDAPTMSLRILGKTTNVSSLEMWQFTPISPNRLTT